MIAKSITANENKLTYEKTMASSEEPQWRENIDEEIK
jgi:hypothetical protein